MYLAWSFRGHEEFKCQYVFREATLALAPELESYGFPWSTSKTQNRTRKVLAAYTSLLMGSCRPSLLDYVALESF